VSVRRLALESAIMIVTIAMRLSPLERDLLAAGLLALHQRLWPGENLENAVQGQPSRRCRLRKQQSSFVSLSERDSRSG